MDSQLRTAAFGYLMGICPEPASTATWAQLQRGFVFQGESVSLIGQKGIWKPRQAELPLSITTSAKGVYDDEVGPDGLLRYRYEGTDPNGYRNVWLRTCSQQQVPLIYLHGIAKGIYMPTWPVFIVADNPEALSVTVAVEDAKLLNPDLSIEVAEESRRRYHTRLVRNRLHQASFRDRVLQAYRNSCAICSLKHVELLEAAHITPDADPGGEPIVSNGLSLCTIHHTAFDRHVLGIRPDYVIELRSDLLEEVDGPMLRYGLQEFHESKLILPRKLHDRPEPDRLEERYEQFRQAS